MTEKELYNEYQKSDYKSFIDFLINKIAVLEKENAELKEKLKGAEKAGDYWKDSCFGWQHRCVSRKPFKVAVKAQKQLTKATEIIKKLYADYYDPCITESDLKYRDEIFAEIKQFLSEVEK